MSEHSTTGEGQTNEQTDFAAKIAQLEATNARLLEESKLHKTRHDEKQRALEEADRAKREKLEAEGDYKKLLESERSRLKAIEADNKALKQTTLYNKVKETVNKFAGDVWDIEDVLNQPKFSHILKEGINEEKLEVDEEIVKRYLGEVLNAKPFLKKNHAGVGVITSKGYTPGQGSKPIDQMSLEDIKKYASEVYGRKK